MVHIIQLMEHGAAITLLAVVQESMVSMKECFPAAKYLDVLLNLMKKAIDLSSEEMDDVDAIRELGEGWVAEESFAIANYCSLKYSNSFVKAIIAVNHGGDSDSTGAVTGNIMRAYLGMCGIPEKYIEYLELKDTILEIADYLYNDCKLTE